MSEDPHAPIRWLDAAAPAVTPRADAAFALVCDLRDPAMADLLRTPPGDGDRLDEARPGASDRRWFHPRRAALRSLVGLYIDVAPQDVRIRYDAPGAPRVIAPAPCFVSVSGRGPWAMLAVSPRPVGVDVEPLDTTIEPVETVLHAVERMRLRAQDEEARARAFLQIWTAKEAWLKACGEGLTRDPASVRLDFDGDRLAHVDDPAEPARLHAGETRAIAFGDTTLLCACVTLDTAR